MSIYLSSLNYIQQFFIQRSLKSYNNAIEFNSRGCTMVLDLDRIAITNTVSVRTRTTLFHTVTKYSSDFRYFFSWVVFIPNSSFSQQVYWALRNIPSHNQVFICLCLEQESSCQILLPTVSRVLLALLQYLPTASVVGILNGLFPIGFSSITARISKFCVSTDMFSRM